jgi:hypothetical protein
MPDRSFDAALADAIYERWKSNYDAFERTHELDNDAADDAYADPEIRAYACALVEEFTADRDRYARAVAEHLAGPRNPNFGAVDPPPTLLAAEAIFFLVKEAHAELCRERDERALAENIARSRWTPERGNSEWRTNTGHTHDKYAPDGRLLERTRHENCRACEREYQASQGRYGPIHEKRVAEERRIHRSLVALLAILVIGGCVWMAVAQSDSEIVYDYCSYGSVSRPQLDRCLDVVDRIDVEMYADRRHPTNAARYAMGELSRCLADAGPFCRQRG